MYYFLNGLFHHLNTLDITYADQNKIYASNEIQYIYFPFPSKVYLAQTVVNLLYSVHDIGKSLIKNIFLNF